MNIIRYKKIILGIAFCAGFLSAGRTWGQVTDTQSPYSFYGLGALTQNPLQNGMAMGGIFNGLRDSIAVNFLNPASYTSIDVTQLNFAFEFNQLKYGNQSNYNLYVNQIGLGIPLMNRKRFGWGMYLGFSPLSQIRYNFGDTTEVILGADTVIQRNEYTGNGGLNKLTLGSGFRIGRHFSFGANMHYVFGVSDRNRSLVLPVADDFLSVRVQEKTSVGTLFADFGAQYFGLFKVLKRKRPNTSSKDTLNDRSKWPVQEKHYHFSVGATYNLGQTFHANFDQLGIQYFAGSVETGVDTFLLTPTTSQSITTPHTFGAGFTISNPEIWTIGADLNYGTWSQFAYFDQPTVKYHDSWNVSVGFEFTPDYNDRWGKKLFFKNIVYRTGFRYYNRPLRPDDNPVDEFAMSFGLGLPFGFKKVYNENLDIKNILSYINIGMEGGFAQSRNGGIINETFFRLNVGITLRDKWFTKRRFN